MVLVDGLDLQIIALLRRDARSSYRSIGEAVGLSASAVKRRVDQLSAAGVIRGFTVSVDPSAGEGAVEAFVELHCSNRTRPQAIVAAVSELPEVVAAYTVSGDADALLRVRARDIGELERTIERIRSHRDAERTKSVIVLSTLFERDGVHSTPAPS
jgi:DNA-binding Lrp family transcriptional regulator